eukprot:6467511-Amphidinium_carterae.1
MHALWPQAVGCKAPAPQCQAAFWLLMIVQERSLCGSTAPVPISGSMEKQGRVAMRMAAQGLQQYVSESLKDAATLNRSGTASGVHHGHVGQGDMIASLAAVRFFL